MLIKGITPYAIGKVWGDHNFWKIDDSPFSLFEVSPNPKIDLADYPLIISPEVHSFEQACF
jgi:hypothetical protein